MFSIENILKVLNIAILKPSNLVVAILSAVVSYCLLAIFSNLNVLIDAFSSGNMSLFFTLSKSMVLGFPGTLSTFNLFLTFVLSILIGINIALVFNNLRKGILFDKSQSGSVIGVLFAPVVSLCSVCVTGIGLAGFSISLALLPFGGLELTFIAILMLVISIFWMIENDPGNLCAS